jgi:hypothetical protein
MPDHDKLTSAFAEYRSAARQGFAAEQTESVFQAARQRRTRRMVVSTVAAALTVATVLVAGAMLRPTAAPPLPPAETPSPSATVSASASASPTPSAAVNGPRTDPANEVRFLTEAARQRLRSATITLPAWPTGFDVCAAGRFTFVDGKVRTGATESGIPYTYYMLFRTQVGIYADLDGSPGDEMVVPLGCGEAEVYSQLLVLKDNGGNLETMGYIPDVPSFDRFYPSETGLMVEVIDATMTDTKEQRRRYSWNGSRFTQTWGPTTFPPTPDVRNVDLRNSFFQIADHNPCAAGILSFVDGISGSWRREDRDFPGDVSPEKTIELGEISTGLLSEPDEHADRGDALVTAVCRSQGNDAVTWVLKVSHGLATSVLRVGEEGVTGVVSHRIVSGVAEIVVNTKDGQRTWRYSYDDYARKRIS